MPNAIIIGIFVAPILILHFLRINAIFVYLALCLGEVLAIFVGNTQQLVNISTHAPSATSTYITSGNFKLLLLLLPVLLTMFFYIKTAKGGKLTLNLLPSIAVGIALVIFLVPLLPYSGTLNVVGSSLWANILKAQGTAIGISSAFVLVLFLLERSKLKHHHEKHGKHKG